MQFKLNLSIEVFNKRHWFRVKEKVADVSHTNRTLVFIDSRHVYQFVSPQITMDINHNHYILFDKPQVAL